MKSFVIALFPDESPHLLGELSDILTQSDSLHFWGTEFDSGLFFVSSDMDAKEIFDLITPDLELDLPHPLFVFQLAGSWAGSGTTNTLEALSDKLSIL